MVGIEYKSSFNPRTKSDEFKRFVQEVFDEEMLKAVEELQRNSPVGVSAKIGDAGLKESWDIEPARNVGGGEIQAAITNNADAALSRLEGRKSGRFPAVEPLRAWVRLKLNVEPRRVNSVAFLIGRKIARQGTERSKRNFKEFNPTTGEPAKNGAVDRALKRIEKRLQVFKGD